MGRVANLVDQLFHDRLPIHRAGGVLALGDHATRVASQFGNRVADVSQVELGPIGRQTAGHLSSAFNQVPRHASAGQSGPIVPLPAELVQGRSHGQRGVGDAAGDDNSRSAGQGFHNPCRSQVGIGTDNRLGEFA